jgi:hypothetical protein
LPAVRSGHERVDVSAAGSNLVFKVCKFCHRRRRVGVLGAHRDVWRFHMGPLPRKLCNTPWAGLGHDFDRFGPQLVAVDPVVVCLPVRRRGCVMLVSETLSVVSGVPGFRDLRSLTVRELRVELADVRRLRAVLDGRLVDIARRIEESTREVGTHEGGQSETWMRGASLSPDTRSVAVQSLGSFSPPSPCCETWCPHVRMDGNCSLSSTMNDIVHDVDGSFACSSVRMLCSRRDAARVETVPHPLGRVNS